MKADIELFFTQLRSGTYAHPDTFANNWAHLIRVLSEIRPVLSKPGVIDMLLQTDKQLVSDLQAITSAVEIIDNFLACLERLGREGDSKPRKN